jgi:glycosyltransferase involved in cell wall biosynthesis
VEDTITAVVPVYNEEKALREVIEKLKVVLDRGRFKYEIIVVDDGSGDRTPEILNEIGGIQVVTQLTNMGYGKALKTGISRAKGNWVLIIDADGSYEAGDVPELLERRKGCDMVIGLRSGRKTYDSFLRKPAKWFLNKLAGYLAGVNIPDLNSGLRVFRKDLALKFWHLFPDRFSFTTTLTMCFLASGYTIEYVNINYLKRIGKSKIMPSHFLQFINLVIKLVIYFEPLKIFIPVSITIFLVGVFFALYSFFCLDRIMDVTVVVLLLTSLQIFFFGLLAELIVKRSGK